MCVRWLTGLGLVVLTLALTGCMAGRPHRPLDPHATGRLIEVRDPGDAAPANAIRQAAYQPRNVLVLSGGGVNGAYSVGVLKGWADAGTRPTFDVVTGISTGALVAPFVFVGTEYDDELARQYKEIKQSDIYRRRFLPALLWSDSLADSAPLKRRLDAAITPELLIKVAQAHKQGRRLYVGTTNLDSKRLVIWDCGAIASSQDPKKLDLFRSVILASASVPGLMPPVAIDIDVDGQKHTELHVDGGVTTTLFLEPEMLGLSATPEPTAARSDTHVYVVVAGKMRPDPYPVERRLLRVAEESLIGLLQARIENDLMRIYLLARFAGAHFAVSAVPETFADTSETLKFESRMMQELFAAGYRAGKGNTWQATPPGLAEGDQHALRGGTHFLRERSAPPALEIRPAAGTSRSPHQ